MKLKLILLLMCLFSTGLFADAQVKKKAAPKQVIMDAPDAIPVIVKSTKRSHVRKPLPVKPVPVKPVPKVLKKPVPVKPTGATFVYPPVKIEKLLQTVKA